MNNIPDTDKIKFAESVLEILKEPNLNLYDIGEAVYFRALDHRLIEEPDDE